MKIEYDKTVDTKYIAFKGGKVAKTQPMNDWLIFDYAPDKSVMGIEILDASEHKVVVSTIGGEFIACFEVEHDGNDIPKITIPNEKIGYGFEVLEINQS
jgi:uncharacterized protein YuzE